MYNYWYDLLHESVRSLTYEDIVNKFGVNCNHYKYMSAINAIPQR